MGDLVDIWSANPAIAAGEAGSPGGIPRENVVVLDNGTGYLKAGFAMDNFPRVSIPASKKSAMSPSISLSRKTHSRSWAFSVVGRPLMRADKVDGEVELKDLMCGDECLPVLSQLNVEYPVKEGKVNNDRWEDMDALWEYTFETKLNVDTQNSLVLLTEAPRNGNKNRIKYCEYMFEKYGFQGLFLSVQAVLTLYAHGASPGPKPQVNILTSPGCCVRAGAKADFNFRGERRPADRRGLGLRRRRDTLRAGVRGGVPRG